MPRPEGTLCTNPTPSSARAGAWKRMRGFYRRGVVFGLDDLREEGERSNLRKYLTALVEAGVLAVVATKNGKAARYRMLRDLGAISPVLRSDGEGITDPNALRPRAPRTAPVAGSGREIVWRALRGFGQRRAWFTARDVVIVVGDVGEDRRLSDVRRYLAALVVSGHLERREGPRGHRFRMAHDTGPLYPLLRSDGSIYDPNEGREYRAAVAS